ncbi:MAG TPA: fimbria/pilus periplasmic chaperone [Geopsychrobacteraceae bacterium]|nr:fimbria/pilus periplasmic chaperone [Geopsychrobacteraceae bacterium]
MKYLSYKLRSGAVLLLSIVLFVVTGFSASVHAAQWQVVPISLDLGHKTKSGVITVRNTGEDILQVSVMAKEWKQDGAGKDQYSDTRNLIFFPKVLQIKPNSERVIRVGVKAPAIKNEQTFRLYIKEAVSPTSRSSQVAVALQFGAPIFVQPLEENISGEIADIKIEDGHINFSVKNVGNTHFRTTRIEVIGKDDSGQQLFNQELKGWYVLAGATQYHKTEVPSNVRSSLKTIDLKIVTDRMELFKAVDFIGSDKFPPLSE